MLGGACSTSTVVATCSWLRTTIRGGRFLHKFLFVGMALFQFDTFSIAPMFATGASSVKVERHVVPEPLVDTSASPNPNASTIMGTSKRSRSMRSA